MNHWGVVYDFANRWPNVHHMVFVLAFPLLLFGAYYQHKRATTQEPVSWRLRQGPRWLRLTLGLAVGGEGLGLLLTAAMLGDYHHTQAIYNQRQYSTVEGVVSHFAPTPKAGHQVESFTVKGVPFAFLDDDASTYGYHQAAARGGVLKAGLHVRLRYVTHQGRNIILRLDTLAPKPLGVQ